jgi:L-threonine kinase
VPAGLLFDEPGRTVLTPAGETHEVRHPPGRTVAGVCHGTLGELYQGPLRAGHEPDIAVVSFPVDRRSRPANGKERVA